MIAKITQLVQPLTMGWTERFSYFFQPVDASFLAYFRIAFGSIMVWETWRFIQNDWVEYFFAGKEFYFTYWPLEFLRPWPLDLMYIHLVLMGIFASFMLLGFCYRISATVFFLMITYLFLLEQARYLNHLYLVCLLSFLMIFLPANRSFSLDALLRPSIKAVTVPAWSLWLLRFQIAVPMFFGGIAKLNSDWLHGEPLGTWLSASTDFPLLGQFFINENVVWVMVYGGLLVDLLFVFYLLNRRTRVFGFMVVLAFHFMNTRLFDIGIFPWFMIAATLIFFVPDWPVRVLNDIKLKHSYRRPALLSGLVVGFLVGGFLPERFDLVQALIGGLGVAVAAYHFDEPFRQVIGSGDASKASKSGTGPSHPRLAGWQKWTLGLLGLWIGLQVVIPLRHLAIPGLVHWTEEGHQFSWHMKLRNKESEGFFIVTDPATQEQWVVDPKEHLTSQQVFKMASRPDMILQFANYIEGLANADGYDDVEVRAQVVSSLNGRPAQNLVDPSVDLTEVPRPWFGHANWILPLEGPLQTGNK